MSYVTYTKSLQRQGWRPMGETSPFAATHLGSVPFRPATLHGNQSVFPPGVHAYAGQHSDRPFSFAGGNVLHSGWRSDGRHNPRRGGRGLGMMGAMVPNASVVTYQGTWSNTSQNDDPNSILQAVLAALTVDGFSIRTSSLGGGSSIPGVTVAEDWLFTQMPFTVTIQLQVNNGQGFSDPNDIISIVRHEVYVATGQFPSADSIPTMQTPDPTQPGGLAAPVGTGQPTVAGAPPPPGSASTFTAWLEQNAMWIGLGLAAVVLGPALMEKL